MEIIVKEDESGNHDDDLNAHREKPTALEVEIDRCPRLIQVSMTTIDDKA